MRHTTIVATRRGPELLYEYEQPWKMNLLLELKARNWLARWPRLESAPREVREFFDKHPELR